MHIACPCNASKKHNFHLVTVQQNCWISTALKFPNTGNNEPSYSEVSLLDSKNKLPFQPSAAARTSTIQARVVVQQKLGCMEAGLGSLRLQVERWAAAGSEASAGTPAGRVWTQPGCKASVVEDRQGQLETKKMKLAWQWTQPQLQLCSLNVSFPFLEKTSKDPRLCNRSFHLYIWIQLFCKILLLNLKTFNETQ